MIGEDDFCALTQLHIELDWLLNRPEALLELWSMAENDEQKELIKSLLRNFTYIDQDKFDSCCKSIVNQIEYIWNLSPENTVISAICDNNNTDVSQQMVYNMENHLSSRWYGQIDKSSLPVLYEPDDEIPIFDSLPVAVHSISDNNNIILVTDFIGTGETVSRKVKYVNKVLSERHIEKVTIYVVSIAAMNMSRKNLDLLGIHYHSVYWLSKGISDDMDDDRRNRAIKAMEALESRLNSKSKGELLPAFGYKNSESLFALEPDIVHKHVFPIFWWKRSKKKVTRHTFFDKI